MGWWREFGRYRLAHVSVFRGRVGWIRRAAGRGPCASAGRSARTSMGFLYIDGHVRTYHGHRAIMSKGYVPRRRLAMLASTDYWINDRSGDPLLVITAGGRRCNDQGLPPVGFTKFATWSAERRLTIVFDRGSWSPRLFAAMIEDGFDLLTCRQGRCRRINTQQFIPRHPCSTGTRWTILGWCRLRRSWSPRVARRKNYRVMTCAFGPAARSFGALLAAKSGTNPMTNFRASA
jgi:hypothetical protein